MLLCPLLSPLALQNAAENHEVAIILLREGLLSAYALGGMFQGKASPGVSGSENSRPRGREVEVRKWFLEAARPSLPLILPLCPTEKNKLGERRRPLSAASHFSSLSTPKHSGKC